MPAGAANRAPFALVDHSGRAVTDRDYLGSYLLIYFGYTRCPDICPTSLALIGAVLDALGAEGERVQPLFVTLDPARDTPPVLADYVGHFHPRLVGLTGDADAIAGLAARYGVRARPYRPDGAEAEDYYLDHTGAFYLVGPDGEGLALFQHDTTADAIAGVIRQLLERDDPGAEGRR